MLLKHNIALTGCGKYVVVFIVINIVFLRLCARKYGEYLHWWDTFCRYFYQSYLRHSCTTLIMFAGCVRACVRAFDCAHIICTKFQMRTTKTSMILDEDFRLKATSMMCTIINVFFGFEYIEHECECECERAHTHTYAHASAPLMMRKKWLAASWLSTF